MENRSYHYPFSPADVAFLVESMSRFVHLSNITPPSPLCMLIKHTYIGVTVLIHNLLRLAGYYEHNEK